MRTLGRRGQLSGLQPFPHKPVDILAHAAKVVSDLIIRHTEHGQTKFFQKFRPHFIISQSLSLVVLRPVQLYDQLCLRTILGLVNGDELWASAKECHFSQLVAQLPEAYRKPELVDYAKALEVASANN